MVRPAIALLTLLTGAACAAHRPMAPMPAPPLDATPLRGLTHESLHGALWMQTSAEYDTLARQTWAAAERALSRALDGTGSAALEQEDGGAGKPPAVVVDIDETMLDNAPFQLQLDLEGTDYCEATWTAWVETARARAVPGALAFAQAAEARGVRVVYVTNRTHAVEEATIRNLRCAERRDGACVGFPLKDGDDLLTIGESEAPGAPAWTSDKTARRAFVARTHRILLLVGDDLRDFVSVPRGTAPEERVAIARRHADRWGDRWFLLPNAMYGSWEQSLHAPGLDDEALLRSKRAPGFREPRKDGCARP
jgi:5'-nucleotidase (lipoprotein e(P4) family)